MSKTAAMTLSSATSKTGQVVTATCTVTNNDGTAINVTSITPTCPVTGGTAGSTPVSLGMPPIGGAFPTAVAASGGTLAVSWPVVGLAPVTSYGINAEQDSLVYDVGATVYLSDGTIVTASTTTLTVSHVAL